MKRVLVWLGTVFWSFARGKNGLIFCNERRFHLLAQIPRARIHKVPKRKTLQLLRVTLVKCSAKGCVNL